MYIMYVDVTHLLQEIPVTLFSVAIHKAAYWQQYPSQNPYEIAYIFLIEQYQKFLQAKDALGICIIDPREGQVHKSFIGLELDQIHHLMQWEKSDSWHPCPNVIERVLFFGIFGGVCTANTHGLDCFFNHDILYISPRRAPYTVPSAWGSFLFVLIFSARSLTKEMYFESNFFNSPEYFR